MGTIPAMIRLLFFFINVTFRLFVLSFCGSNLEREIVLVRKENEILKRKIKKVRINSYDRLFFVCFYRQWTKLLSRITVIKPSTVIAWHRKLAAKKWDYSKRRLGRPPISDEVKELIIEIKRDNPRWGAGKIKGAMRKLGISISKSSVLCVLKANGFKGHPWNGDESWLSFLKSHCTRYWACDFFVVDTLLLKRIFVYFVIDTLTRELILFSATENPCASWLKNVVRSWFMYRDDLPNFLVSDRDGIYGNWFRSFLKEHYNIRLYRTPPRTPNCNSFAERMVLTFRQELLDRRIIYGIPDLHALLATFVSYYNEQRSHSAIGFDAPKQSYPEPSKTNKVPKYRKRSMVDGLVVEYELAA